MSSMSLSTVTGHLSPAAALHRESSMSVSTISGPLSPTSTTFGTESWVSNASTTFHSDSWASNASTTFHTDSWVSNASTTFHADASVAPTSSAYVTDSWEKAHYLSLTLWDIDREFQKSHEAYEQWLSQNRRKKRFRLRRLVSRKTEDRLGRSLRLGRSVQALLEKGIETFGSKFEQGDSTCNTTLSSLLLRVQHEIRVPLEDCALSRFSMTLSRDDLMTAAKGVRRACLQALRDQFSRLEPSNFTPYLPPPRFSVNFCPFAVGLQKETKKSFQTSKVRRHDRYDEREICPHCNAHIAVTMHSGLPAYRQLLFSSHLSPAPGVERHKASFACTGCYKTFEDSYGFLDHVFQKEIGSERSCQQRFSTQWHFNRVFAESEPALVEKCLRNCLKREATRAKTMRKSREAKSKELDTLSRASSMTLVNSPSANDALMKKSPLEALKEDTGTPIMSRGKSFGRVYFFHTSEYD